MPDESRTMPDESKERLVPDGGATAEGDVLVEALDDLSVVIDEVTDDARELGREVRRVRTRRARGASAREALSGTRRASAREALSGTRGPRLVRVFDNMVSRLTAASGSLRRAVVGAMLGEGERVTAIARLLGVSHQRISSVRRGQPT
jgi:hypothetical protein